MASIELGEFFVAGLPMDGEVTKALEVRDIRNAPVGSDEFAASRASTRTGGYALSDSRDSVDLSDIADPDLDDVDVIARATLEARRRGIEIRWGAATAQMRALIALCGLDEYLWFEPDAAGDPSPEKPQTI